ncbi:MAG: cupredoxin domain-containing protein [Herpetosiphonaceae bacterium]|nr:cupredoxin domain-containing protein [Herpetosiphonaceae bacterium]
MRVRLFSVGAAIIAGLSLAACGGGGNGSGPPAQQLTITAVDGIKYDKPELDATANQPFVVNFVNNGGLQHSFVIKNAAGSDVAFVPGPDKTTYLDNGQSKKSAPITLAAGTYEFYCAFPGHEQTMKGNVVVK